MGTAKKYFPYAHKKMQERIDGYFESCTETGRLPTIPGLCLALGITMSQYRKLLFNTDEEEAPQPKHLLALENARARICDVLEQRSDTASVFKLKQREYAGYADRPDGRRGEAIEIKITLAGVDEDINPGG